MVKEETPRCGLMEVPVAVQILPPAQTAASALLRTQKDNTAGSTAQQG